MSKKLLLSLVLVGIVTTGGVLYLKGYDSVEEIQRSRPLRNAFQEINEITHRDEPKVELDIPDAKTIPGGTHVFQTFNNCGPASLSITLSLYGINVSQAVLGEALRPYQNAAGDNDDKSTPLAEMAIKAEEYGFTSIHRPGGNTQLLKEFIANDMPVITRTWLKVNDDVGHFRVIKGYDDNAQELIQDDSYDGKNLWYSYDEFNEIWKKYNYEYLVLVPDDKLELAKQIVGANYDKEVAWEESADFSRGQLAENPDDTYARFNLVVSLYNLGDYEGTVEEFEKIEDKLSPRTLWYQIEPIQAYYELGQYDRVFEISDRILNNGNRAFSELYYLKGQVYLKQGNEDAARAEFEKAVLYNKHYKPAQEALAKL